MGFKFREAVFGGGWLTLLLLLLGIVLITPHAAPFKTDHDGVPHGWASESGILGRTCKELWAAHAGGRLRNLLTAPHLEQMPWGSKHLYEPIDYEALIYRICDAEAGGHHAAAHGSQHFVTRVGRELWVNGSAFRYVGFNAPQLLSLAADSGSTLPAADAMMSNAAQLGLKVARVWAFRDGHDWRPPSFRQQAFSPLQVRPGVYNETVFAALDYAIAAAQRAGVYVTLTLTNWHRDYGGVQAYMQWLQGGSDLSAWSVSDFYTDERARLLFKANMAALATRRNSVTGRLYRDDPTIIAWDLINEPRCPACPGATKTETLVQWVDDISAFMKAVAPHQLVTVSSEGYYGESTLRMTLDNPGLWAVCEGMDFDKLYALPNLDYAVAHLYLQMKTWDDYARQECDLQCALNWSKKWLTSHIDYCNDVLGKPFVLEEFGLPKAAGSKDDLFRLVYDTLKGAINDGKASVAGSNFWAAAVQHEPDWDGYYLYLDGSLPAATPMGDSLSEAEQTYWDALYEAGEVFRRKPQAEQCYEVVKRDYAYLLEGAAHEQKKEYYNNTLEIVLEAVSHWKQMDST